MHAHAALAAICLLAFVHHVTSGIRLLPMSTDMPYSIYMRLEWIPLFSGSSYIHFVSATARVDLHKYIIAGLYGAGGILTLAAIFIPVKLSTHAHMLPEIVGGCGTCGWTRLVVLAVFRRHEGAWFVLIGSLALMAGLTDDAFSYQPGSIHLMTPLLLIFLALQSLATARQFSSAFESVENLGVKLIDTNSAYTRFMPAEFLSYMNKESILCAVRRSCPAGDDGSVQRHPLIHGPVGDNDARAENFEFLNGYLSRVGPVIRGHNGFIDKDIGDGIMALFPG